MEIKEAKCCYFSGTVFQFRCKPFSNTRPQIHDPETRDSKLYFLFLLFLFQIKNELSDIKRVREFAQWWVNNSDMIHQNVSDYINRLKQPVDQV